MVKNFLKALMYNLNLATSTILMLLSRHIGVVNSLITCISLPYYHGRQYMACWHNCCFKEGRQHSLKSVVVALLHYVRTKPICVKWNQGYPKQWNTTFFRKSFCVLRNNHTTLAIKKHTEHKVVRCWWSYTTKHKLVASQSTVKKLSALDLPQTSNITSLLYH